MEQNPCQRRNPRLEGLFGGGFGDQTNLSETGTLAEPLQDRVDDLTVLKDPAQASQGKNG